MKKWGHLFPSFHVPFLSYFWVMLPFLNYLKKCIFCNFVLTSTINLSLLKQFRYMHLKDLVLHSQKMVLFVMLWLIISEILCLKSYNFVKFLLSWHLFDVLIANISWTVAQTPINYSIFWKSVMRTFRCIYVNYFSRLRFLAEVGTKIFCFFGQYTDHNSGRKHGN